MPGESDLERKLKDYAEAYGCYVRKFTSAHAGVPDKIISKELTLFLEIKDHGERPTDLQKNEISTICATGGCATWCDNYDDGAVLVDAVLANRRDRLRKECKTRNYWSR